MVSKEGPRPGNHTCAYLLCKPCCTAASLAAQAQGTFRVYCRPHNAPGYEGEPASTLSSTGPVVGLPSTASQVPPPSGHLTAPTAARAAALAQSAAPAPLPAHLETRTIQQLIAEYDAQYGSPNLHEQPIPPPVQPSASAATEANGPLASTPSSPRHPPTQRAPKKSGAPKKSSGLSMPIDPSWLQEKLAASSQPSSSARDAKTATNQLSKEEITKVVILLWQVVRLFFRSAGLGYSRLSQPGEPPLRLVVMVPTFPLVKLLDIPSVVSGLSLTANTLLEYLDPERLPDRYWVRSPADTTLKVNSTRRVNNMSPRLFMRLCKAITSRWSDTDCPGLEEELGLAGFTQSRKRRPDRAVSPLRKALRSAPDHDVASARRAESPKASTSCSAVASTVRTAAFNLASTAVADMFIF